MFRRRSSTALRVSSAAVMLFAFAVRALIPQGFMPATNRPFSFEICPEGLPAPLMPMGGSDRGGMPSPMQHCPFGLACAPGPPLQAALPNLKQSPQIARAVRLVSAVHAVRLVHLPQARGPPAQA